MLWALETTVLRRIQQVCVTEKQEHPQNPKEPSRAKGTESQVAPKRTWSSGIPLSPAQLSYQSLV